MKHPEHEILKRYAKGSLDLTMRLLVETHLEFCPQCEAAVKQLAETEIITLRPDFEETPFAPDFLDSIMNKLPDKQATKKKSNSILPAFLQDEILPEPEWQWTTMWPSSGKIGTILSDPVSGYSLYAAYFKAGAKAPKHKHLDDEYTVLLQGGYQYDGNHIITGDWDKAETGSSHGPLIDDHEDCWCIVRSKTRNSVSFMGLDSWREPFVKISNLF